MPQVINIVRGEMSLVGPRPERPALAEQFSREVPGFSERLRVRPGIAGLAQVRGSYWTDPGYKLKYDNLYIETMSPWLDCKLLVLAVWVAIKRVFYGPDASVTDNADYDK
jgi:lipopolysaccharide/colanic/teichoic acid biosynthesis glycosyltransferase